MTTRTTTSTTLSTAARRHIMGLLTEAKRLSHSYWKKEHWAALCAALKAGLHEWVHAVMDAVSGIDRNRIATWGAKKSVQELREQYLAMA